MNIYESLCCIFTCCSLLLNPTRRLALISPYSQPPIRVLNDSLASSAAKAAPLLGNLGNAA